VIAVIMPNDQTVSNDWTKYRTTAREVEKLTGFHFFQNVQEEVAEALRDHRDEVTVRVKERKRKKKGRED
jgi:endonuclease G